jgi:hypothetical protein
MGAMKHIATKLQSGLHLNNDEKRFFKVFCKKPTKKPFTAQLSLFDECPDIQDCNEPCDDSCIRNRQAKAMAKKLNLFTADHQLKSLRTHNFPS